MTSENTEDQLLEVLLNKLKETVTSDNKFEPFIYHNKDGNCLEIYLSPETYLAEWVNPEITLHIDPQNKEKILGLTISGISKIINQ